MATSVTMIPNPDEYLNARCEAEDPADFGKLYDFDLQTIIRFDGDLALAKGEHLFSSDWLTRATRGEVTRCDRSTLILIEGNVTSEEVIAVSEDCGIVRGDIECPGLFVDGESSFDCLGTVRARYIWSTYNGCFSRLRSAETGFFFAGEGMLHIDELAPGAFIIEEYADWQVLENAFLPGMVVDGAVSNECRQKIAAGDVVLRHDYHKVLRGLAQLGGDTDAGVRDLAATEGISEFRLWDEAMPKGTALHALAKIEAPCSTMRGWIQLLTESGVPLDALSQRTDRRGRVTFRGNALQISAVSGNLDTARAFAAEGLDIDARMGNHSISLMILEPLKYAARYPERSSNEEKRRLLTRSQSALALCEELGMQEGVHAALASKATPFLDELRSQA